VTRMLRQQQSGNELVSMFEASDVNYVVYVAQSQDSATLAWIMLMNVNPDLTQALPTTGTLGQMISLFGSPSVAEVNAPTVTYIFYVDNRIEVTAVRDGVADSIPLSINHSLFSIALYAPGHLEDVYGMSGPPFKQWRGFRQVGSYRNAPSVGLSP
jgi:hypothetical protein